MYWSVCLSVSLCLSPCISLSLCLCLSQSLSVCLSLLLYVCVCVLVSLSLSPPLSLSSEVLTLPPLKQQSCLREDPERGLVGRTLPLAEWMESCTVDGGWHSG